jgi:putative transposase
VNAIAVDAVKELRENIGVSGAAQLFGLLRSTFYYQPVPEDQRQQRGGGDQPNALDEYERTRILDVLRSNDHVDHSPYDVFASLLDEGKYLASIRTFYRVLEGNGETTTRTNQRTSIGSRPIPVLCASRPNEVWSWDISPIATSMKRRFFYLYAVIDIFSRFVPGWCVEEVEDKDLARELFEKTGADQGIVPNTLTVHSDNGPQMRSDAMAEFYAISGISKSRSRPRVSNDNPYSEALFKTAKYVPLYPGSFKTIDAARSWFTAFFAHYNYQHYHSGIGLLTPASVHNGTAGLIVEARQHVLDNAHRLRPERFRRGAPTAARPEPAWINKPAHPGPEEAVTQ